MGMPVIAKLEWNEMNSSVPLALGGDKGWGREGGGSVTSHQRRAANCQLPRSGEWLRNYSQEHTFPSTYAQSTTVQELRLFVTLKDEPKALGGWKSIFFTTV